MQRINGRSRMWHCLFAVLLMVSSTSSAWGQPCQNLVFSDEFDGTAVDTGKWEFQEGDGCNIGLCGWGNGELQWYKAENATVADGILTITAKMERMRGSRYTSARLRTANRPGGGEWTNGRFEARIKLPEGQGLWPAFWMLPTDPDVGWPSSGEIDIMESTGQASMFASGTIHFGDPFPDNSFTGASILKQPGKWSDDFHVFAIEWDPLEIRWYVDDLLYSVRTPADLGGHSWPFENYAYHFLVNVAVGGTLGGTPDDSIFPRSMLVDYVRVYDRGQPSLSGPHIVGPAASGVSYSVIDENGTGGSYAWTVPAGATLVSGQGTSSITVDFADNGSGAVEVSVDNSCGTADLSLPVFVEPTLTPQFVFDDFESNRNVTYTFVEGSFDPSAPNPSPDSVNSSAVVAQYVREPVPFDVIAMQTADLTDAGLLVSGQEAFFLDVLTTAPAGTLIFLQLEDSSLATPENFPAGRHSRYSANTGPGSGWQRLRFRLDARLDGNVADTQVDSIIILFDSGNSSSDTYYWDNFDLYGMGGGGQDPAASVHVENIATGTQGAGMGQKFGTATVTVRDNNGDPVADVNVTGTFSGTFSETANAVTDANGEAVLQTQSTAGGKVTVNVCVDNLSHATLSYDPSANQVTCQ
ncbi:MAG TPA: family 16 glycosylhydrolase [Acidobacteriota bacterium]|nr:family 16 glycosylhydrolase [Acidobacteriota bacterium]